MRRWPAPSLVLLFLAGCAAAPLRPPALDLGGAQPPVARKEPHETTLHGEKLVDDYFWLKQKGTPAVESYLSAENAYAAAVMKPTGPLQAALYEEMVARIQETDTTVPYRKDGWLYYSRTVQGLQYPIQCRKRDAAGAAEEIILDQNELAKTVKFLGLSGLTVSDDGNLLAYGTDTTGYRQFDLHVKDLRTGAVLADTAARVTSIAWAADNQTLFYTVEDEVSKRSHRLYRHTLGSKDADALLFDERDERFGVQVRRTLSKAFLVLDVGSHTTSEAHVLAADQPLGSFRIIAARVQDQQYKVEHGGGFFYLLDNSTGRNYRVVKAPVGSPGRESWQELIAQDDDVMRDALAIFSDHYVVHERVSGVPQLRVVMLQDGGSRQVELPEPSHSVDLEHNAEFDSPLLRYAYESNVTPDSVYDYDVRTGKSELKKRIEVKGYDPTRYAAERIYATARDGARIPISLVYRRGAPRDGSAPLFLNAYGSYGYPYPVVFNPTAISLLDRGVVVAFAHIRGGGDLGKKWHDQGRMMAKMNTFTDFIAAAEHLIHERYTASDRLGIMGGSAGGLLMGAVTNPRPELFKTVISLVPFVDVINTMSDETLPLTVGEFEEWGNPKVEEQYRYMRQYSPYENVSAKAYPAMLVRTSYNDSQVGYWEPAKYVARLRATKTDGNPLVFKCDMDPAGHGGKSGRYDRLKTTAFDFAWLLTQIAPAR